MLTYRLGQDCLLWSLLLMHLLTSLCHWCWHQQSGRLTPLQDSVLSALEAVFLWCTCLVSGLTIQPFVKALIMSAVFCWQLQLGCATAVAMQRMTGGLTLDVDVAGLGACSLLFCSLPCMYNTACASAPSRSSCYSPDRRRAQRRRGIHGMHSLQVRKSTLHVDQGSAMQKYLQKYCGA